MINAVLTVGFGAVAIAIGFGLSRRAQDTEWRSDAWDRAGALLKILGAFAVLHGVALLIRPSRSLMADRIVVTQKLSSQGSGLQLKPSRLVGLALVDPIYRVHSPPAGILNPGAGTQKASDIELGGPSPDLLLH